MLAVDGDVVLAADGGVVFAGDGEYGTYWGWGCGACWG